MKAAGRDGHDIRPGGYVALAVIVIAHSHYRAVRLQAHRVIAACRDGIPNRHMF